MLVVVDVWKELGAGTKQARGQGGKSGGNAPTRNWNIYIIIYFIIYYMYSAFGPVWQRPELSQATGMALVRCILGKFLGVVCHCFPPRLDVPTFATRCLHVVTKREILAAEGGTVGENVVR